MSALLQWLQSQPREVRDNIAVLVARFVDEPRFHGLGFMVNEPARTFETWIEEQQSSTGKDTVAEVIRLRELIQFFVIEHFGSKTQWERIAKGSAESAAQLHEQGHGPEMTDPLERIEQSAHFRQKLWERSASSWATLVNGSLSNEHLRFWLLAAGDA